MGRTVLHVDLDQFLAAVEILRRPELRGKPVIVGGTGDPTQRGVVMTASYEARRFGIDSGMPLRTAARRCPQAVFLPSDSDAYRKASKDVMATLAMAPGVLEVAGWDEAFLEVQVDDPERLAGELQRAVRERTGLSCSVGIGENKLQAKIASGLAKPGGVARLTGSNWVEVMGRRHPTALWGIGKKRGRQLRDLGIRTVSQLARADPVALAARFGPNTGPWLSRLARGEDHSAVRTGPHPPKSLGREVTFQEDLADPAEVRAAVARLARGLAGDLLREGRPGLRVIVKVRFVPFDTHTHGVQVPGGTTDANQVEEAALAALDRFDLDRPVRLVGVRADLPPIVLSGADTLAFPPISPHPSP